MYAVPFLKFETLNLGRNKKAATHYVAANYLQVVPKAGLPGMI